MKTLTLVASTLGLAAVLFGQIGRLSADTRPATRPAATQPAANLFPGIDLPPVIRTMQTRYLEEVQRAANEFESTEAKAKAAYENTVEPARKRRDSAADKAKAVYLKQLDLVLADATKRKDVDLVAVVGLEKAAVMAGAPILPGGHVEPGGERGPNRAQVINQEGQGNAGVTGALFVATAPHQYCGFDLRLNGRQLLAGNTKGKFLKQDGVAVKTDDVLAVKLSNAHYANGFALFYRGYPPDNAAVLFSNAGVWKEYTPTDKVAWWKIDRRTAVRPARTGLTKLSLGEAEGTPMESIWGSEGNCYLLLVVKENMLGKKQR